MNLSNAAQRWFGRFVTPLYRHDGEGALKHEGSGVLLSEPNAHWLFTAAHLFDHTDEVFLFGARKPIRLPRGLFQGSTNLDLIFARIPLETIVDIIDGGASFFPSSFVEAPEKPPRDGECLFVGYPDLSVEVCHETRQIAARTTSLRNFFLPIAEYRDFGLNKKWHVAARFDAFAHEGTLEPLPQFDPKGLSGGAILCGSPIKGITLVGIATTYLPDKRIIVGSRFNDLFRDLRKQARETPFKILDVQLHEVENHARHPKGQKPRGCHELWPKSLDRAMETKASQ